MTDLGVRVELDIFTWYHIFTYMNDNDDVSFL